MSILSLNQVSFSVPKGCIYGLLGPNGAGKTTTIRMITGIMHPDTGEIYLFDKKVNETIPPQIGYMPEERGLYKKMTIWDHLLYLAQLKGMTETDAKKELKFWIERLEMKTWYTKSPR